ncbi:MAG: hypothetical protein JWM04_1554 [Verrucomicrobiales bacterium]|nr:hypothetical protein [Verrucomicrobiales bacterium]
MGSCELCGTSPGILLGFTDGMFVLLSKDHLFGLKHAFVGVPFHLSPVLVRPVSSGEDHFGQCGGRNVTERTAIELFLDAAEIGSLVEGAGVGSNTGFLKSHFHDIGFVKGEFVRVFLEDPTDGAGAEAGDLSDLMVGAPLRAELEDLFEEFGFHTIVYICLLIC